MGTKVKEIAIVSKMFCSSSQVVLGIRTRPRVVGGGGFIVTDMRNREGSSPNSLPVQCHIESSTCDTYYTFTVE
nr:hypothetical protein [Tanacetum cinerariifolium]